MCLDVSFKVSGEDLYHDDDVNNKACHRKEASVESEEHEVLVVSNTKAIVDPGAMMIHLHDTLIAFRAVMGSLRFPVVAFFALFVRGFGGWRHYMLVDYPWV